LADGNISVATPVLTLRNNLIYVGGAPRVNMRDVLPTIISVSASGSNKPIKVSLIKNPTLTSPLWVAYDPTHSFASYDTSATGYTGGDIIFASSFSSGSGIEIDLFNLDIILRPSDLLCLVIEPTGTAADFVASMAWKEDV
jgi:hypothetical protein